MGTVAQIEMDFSARGASGAVDPVLADAVRRVESLLAQRGTWVTARQIEEAIGLGDRTLRQVAKLAAGRIVSGPGRPGYKLFELCTPEEVQSTVRALASQRNEMDARIRDLTRRWHSRFGRDFSG